MYDRPHALAAARERDSRARHYPGQVERREITEAFAAADLAAWAEITLIFETGQFVAGTPWPPLFAAADHAIASRDRACTASPTDDALALRRHAVRSIHYELAWHHWVLTAPATKDFIYRAPASADRQEAA